MQLDTISGLSILIPLITAGIFFKHLNKTLKKLSVFICFSAITEFLAARYASHGINNMPISHLYAFIQVPLLAWVFRDLISGIRQKVIIILSVLFLLFSAVNLAFWEDLLEFNSNQRYFAAVCIITFCAFYFIQLFIDTKILKIELDPYFWMSAGILIYTAGTLFLFIYAQEVLNGANNAYWNLNCILNIFLNMGLTIALWLGSRKSN